MSPQEIQALISQGIDGATVMVEGADGRHFSATVISDRFSGLTPVKKQQLVYATIGEQVTSGAIHAITLQTFTVAEWEKKQKSGF
ncbi:MAG: BolA family protein [Pseudomonadota bacterium]